MKKFYSLLIVMTLAFSVSCYLQDEEDEAAPIGSGTLNVTVNYTGTSPAFDEVDVSSPGTTENYIYLYESFGVKSDSPLPVYSASSGNNNSIITIDNIAPGSYYLAVCYDWRGAGEEPALSKSNPYEIYDGGTGTKLTANKLVIDIEEDGEINLSVTFDETWRMGAGMANGRMFITP